MFGHSRTENIPSFLRSSEIIVACLFKIVVYFSTGTRSNFVYDEGSIAWWNGFPQSFSPLREADKLFDRIPIYNQDTLLCINPITRQSFNYAIHLSCDNNPRKISTLDPDNVEHYLLTPKLVLRATTGLACWCIYGNIWLSILYCKSMYHYLFHFPAHNTCYYFF